MSKRAKERTKAYLAEFYHSMLLSSWKPRYIAFMIKRPNDINLIFLNTIL